MSIIMNTSTNMTMAMEYKHVSYFEVKNKDDLTNERLWFIIKQNPKDDFEFESARKLSVYDQNKKITGCTYNPVIEKTLQNLT